MTTGIGFQEFWDDFSRICTNVIQASIAVESGFDRGEWGSGVSKVGWQVEKATIKTLFGVAIEVEEASTIGLDKSSGSKRHLAGIEVSFRSIPSIWYPLYEDH